jgi:glycolate oxidase FAD binding subunit
MTGLLAIDEAAVLAPPTVGEAEAMMAEAARERRTLLFAGGRTAMGLGAPPRRVDTILDTRGLSRIVEHVPADQVVVAEAGVPLEALQRALAAHGQRLAIDPPSPGVATLGGIVASNAFGPLRARHGSVRDLLIGVSFVLADGTAARAGGKVVKNVAGFDVAKLLTGSLGTLALVTTVTFRLHPLPEAADTVLWKGRSAADVAALPGRLGRASLEPTAVVAVAVGADPLRWDIAVRFDGFAAGVAAQCEKLVGLLGREGDGNGDGVADAASAAAASSRHDRVRSGGPLRVKIAAPRSAFERVATQLAAPIASGGAVWYPTLGLGFAAGDSPDAEACARAIGDAREEAEALGGSLVVETAPAEVRALTDVWGTSPGALGLMRAVKDRFDPEGRLAPGRFVGGL